MVGQPSRDTFEIVKSVCGWIAGALLMIVVGVTGSAYSSLKSDQDKQAAWILELQKSSITEEKLKDTEARINSNLQREVGLIRSEMQSQNRLLERIVDRLDKQQEK